MEFDPIEGAFGAVVRGAELTGPRLEATVAALERALDEHVLLVIPEAGLSPEQFGRFGACFGELEDFRYFAGDKVGPSMTLSNLDRTGRIAGVDDPVRQNAAGDMLWHTDNSFRVNRARYSMLLADEVPRTGGETEYCNTRAAYAALPAEMQRDLDGRVAIHSVIYSRARAGFTEWTDEQRAALHPVPQPLIFANPRNGRKSLFIAEHIAEVEGMASDDARRLVAQLIEFATSRQFVYAHRWRRGDIVIWDDRATMHRRAPYDDLNEVRRLYTMRVLEPSDLYDPAQEYFVR